jgi:hypothetical protein
MRTKDIKDSINLQVPGQPLADIALVKLIKEAEKGPFMTLDEHRKKMDEWMQKNSR